MAYTYRFKDIYDNTIYVGYTGQKMSERMHQHFTKGHLPKDCYSSVAKIEYIKWKTKSDAQLMEVYFISQDIISKIKGMISLLLHLMKKNGKLIKYLKNKLKKVKLVGDV